MKTFHISFFSRLLEITCCKKRWKKIQTKKTTNYNTRSYQHFILFKLPSICWGETAHLPEELNCTSLKNVQCLISWNTSWLFPWLFLWNYMEVIWHAKWYHRKTKFYVLLLNGKYVDSFPFMISHHQQCVSYLCKHLTPQKQYQHKAIQLVELNYITGSCLDFNSPLTCISLKESMILSRWYWYIAVRIQYFRFD